MASKFVGSAIIWSENIFFNCKNAQKRQIQERNFDPEHDTKKVFKHRTNVTELKNNGFGDQLLIF